MNILALDLATVTGFAMGHAPADLTRLRSGQFSVKPDGKIECPVEDLVQRGLNLEAFLADVFTFKAAWPDLVVYEAPRAPNADANDGRPRNAESILLPWTLATKTVEFCRVRGVRVEKVWPQSWRPTFLGKATATKGQDIKKLVINRCEEWGYLPPKTPHSQNNRADAVGIWHWAQIRFAHWQPPFEMMFGQKLAIIGARP